MAHCFTFTGITFSCLSNTPGVKKIWINNFDAIESYTETSGIITGVTMSSPTQSFAEFQFNKNTSSISEELQQDLIGGGSFYNQTVTLVIPRRESSKRTKLLLLSAGQPKLLLIVQDSNDIYWVVGISEGANLTANVTGSGTAKTDQNNYTLTFLAEEPEMAIPIDESIVTTITA